MGVRDLEVSIRKRGWPLLPRMAGYDGYGVHHARLYNGGVRGRFFRWGGPFLVHVIENFTFFGSAGGVVVVV